MSSSTTRRAAKLARHQTSASIVGPEASVAAGSSATSLRVLPRGHEACTRTVAALEEVATVEVMDFSDPV